MPETVKNGDFVGDIFHAWEIEEYDQQKERPRVWYTTMFVIGAICLLYSLIRGNFLFMFIVLLFGIILFLQHHQKPAILPVGISSAGLLIGNRLYQYTELNQFYIIYQPPEIQTLYIETKTSLRPLLRLPLPEDLNPIEVRETLLSFLEEDVEKEEEPLMDRLAREWRIQ